MKVKPASAVSWLLSLTIALAMLSQTPAQGEGLPPVPELATAADGSIFCRLTTSAGQANWSWMVEVQRSVNGQNWATLPDEFATVGPGLQQLLLAPPPPRQPPSRRREGDGLGPVPVGTAVYPGETSLEKTFSFVRYAGGAVTATHKPWGENKNYTWIVPLLLTSDVLSGGPPLVVPDNISSARLPVTAIWLGSSWQNGVGPYWQQIDCFGDASAAPVILPQYEPPANLRAALNAELAAAELALIEAVLYPRRTAAPRRSFFVRYAPGTSPPKVLVQWCTESGTLAICRATLDLSHPHFPEEIANGMTEFLTPAVSDANPDRVWLRVMVLPSTLWRAEFNELPHPADDPVLTSGPVLSAEAEAEFAVLQRHTSTLARLILSHKLPPQELTPALFSDHTITSRGFIRSLPRPGMGYHPFDNGGTNVFQRNDAGFSNPVITELCNRNDGSVRTPDAQGNLITPDWIEIYNPSATQTLDLTGWKLSNNPGNLAQWTFPQGDLPEVPTLGIIPPGGLLMVYASNEPVSNIGGKLHASFTLPKEGVQVILSNPQSQAVSSLFVPGSSLFEADWSYGYYVAADGTPQLGYFPQATPGSHNVSKAYIGVAGPAQVRLWRQTLGGASPEYEEVFQQGGCLLDRANGPFFVTLTPPGGWLTPEQLAAGQRQQEVTYTTNGAEPSAFSEVGTPDYLPLSHTIVYRARCQAPDCLPGKVGSFPFIFRDEVVGPATQPGGLPLPDYVNLTDAQLADPGIFHLGQQQPAGYPAILSAAPLGTARYTFDLRSLAAHREPQSLGGGGMDEGIAPLTSAIPTFYINAEPLKVFADQQPYGLVNGGTDRIRATVGWAPTGSAAVLYQAPAELRQAHHTWRLDFGRDLLNRGLFNPGSPVFDPAGSNNRTSFESLNLRYPDSDAVPSVVTEGSLPLTFCRDEWCV